MSEITQKLGFDAQQAIDALNALHAALGPVNTRLLAFSKRASGDTGKKVAKDLDAATRSARKAEDAVKGLGTALQSTGTQGSAGIQKISIGFSGLAKALVAREIVQALNNIKTAIIDTADAAAEFELSVARISNIAQGPGSSINELTESLENLSVQLGRDISEVTEAAFEALQNDLGNTAETMELLGTAADNLALITGGTLTQSINSISSVLKSYNLDISESARITDIFFAAIDKGRITLAELESSLGKITPLAARLDIDFENVAAAMAAITQSGTSAAVANTQLRSILQKLIKPTEELQGAFNKLGVETFNELIARSGNLETALNQIAGALNNDDRAIAAAFGRLRAQLGVFNLLSNEGKIFADTLDVVTNSFGKAAAGADVLRDTDAFRQQQAAEQFNKTMREIGESVLAAKTAFLNFANDTLPAGASIAAVMGKIAGLAVAGIGTGLVVAMTLASTATLALAASAAILLGVAAAGFALGEALNFDIFQAKLDNFNAAVEKANQELVEATSRTVLEGNAAIERGLNQRGETFEAYIDGLEAAFEKETEVIRKASDAAENALADSFSAFRQGLKDIFDDIESQVKGFEKSMKKAKKSVADAQQELDDFNFDREGDLLSDAQKFTRELEKVEIQADKLDEALKDAALNPENAGVAKDIAEALKKAAQEQRKEAENIDNAFNKRLLLAAATENEKKSLEGLVTLSKQEASILAEQEAIGEAAIAKEKRKVQEIAEATVILEAQLVTLGKINALTNPEGFKEASDNVQDTLDGINDMKSELDTNIFDKFGQDANLKKLVEGINTGIEAAEFDFQKVQDDFAKKIAEPEYKVFVDILSNLPEFEGKIGDMIQDIKNASNDPITVTEDIRDSLGEELMRQTAAQNELAGQTEQVIKSNDNTNNLIAQALTIDAGKNTEFIEKFKTEIGELQKKLLDPTLSAEQIAGLQGQLLTMLGGLAKLFNAEGSTLGMNVAKSLALAIKSAAKAVEAKEAEIEFSVMFDPEEIAKLNTAIGTIDSKIEGTKNKQNDVTTAVDGTTTAQVALDTQIKVVIETTNTAVTRMNALKSAAEAAAKAIRDANTATAAAHHGGVPLRQKGGVAFRASGGRGLDTQPAMLSRGEFVMNARSARKFFPQMSAMNAGQEPQFRDEGGSVTNIGDINVNVTGGPGSESPVTTGRQIADSLRRELRRQTSTL